MRPYYNIMKRGKQIEIGFSTYGKAFNVIFTKGLWWYFIFPIIFNILLFYGFFELKGCINDLIMDKIDTWVGFDDSQYAILRYLGKSLSTIISVSIGILFFIVFTYVSGYIIVIMLSPVFAYLAEDVEKKLSGNSYPFDLVQFFKDVIRGMLIAVRNLTIEFFWIILVFFLVMIISWIPVIGWILSPFLTVFKYLFFLFLSAYFYGFSFIDYSLERKKFKIRDSIRFVRKYKWIVISNGLVFAIVLILPYIGIILSGFFATVSVIAASLAYLEVEKEVVGN